MTTDTDDGVTHAPIGAVSPPSAVADPCDKIIHAVDAGGMTFRDGIAISSRCGAPVDRFIPAPTADADGTTWTVPLPWPPRVADLPTQWTRCAECLRPGERPGRRNRIIG